MSNQREESARLEALRAQAIGEVQLEANSADRRFGPFASAHEAYGVLAEEVAEFFDEVKMKEHERSMSRMRREAIQIAACALRIATWCDRYGAVR